MTTNNNSILRVDLFDESDDDKRSNADVATLAFLLNDDDEELSISPGTKEMDSSSFIVDDNSRVLEVASLRVMFNLFRMNTFEDKYSRVNINY